MTDTGQTANWIRTQPGMLRLEGTDFSIKYYPGRDKPFSLINPALYSTVYETLYFAKVAGEARARDHAEIMGPELEIEPS